MKCKTRRKCKGVQCKRRTFHSIHLVESRRPTVQIVFSSVLNSVEDTLVECQLNTVEIIQSLPFHLIRLSCSVIMEDSASR